jgi:uncharacterized protein YbjT (DUF2867 family)
VDQRSTAALAAGARKARFVSAMEADANPKVFCSRMKGELESALAQKAAAVA